MPTTSTAGSGERSLLPVLFCLRAASTRGIDDGSSGFCGAAPGEAWANRLAPVARALITGIAGQDGSYLAELLLAEGSEVVGLDRQETAFEAPNLAAVAGQLEWINGDLLDVPALRDAVVGCGADEVYHLAAPTFVPDSWDDPSQTMAAIAGGTLLFMRLKKWL